MLSQRINSLEQILAEARPRIAEHWSSYHRRLGGAAPTAIARVEDLVDTYFDKLKALPEGAATTVILREIETLFSGLDEANASCNCKLLETDERELLVPIIIEAAAAAGLKTGEFDGGDPTLQFRNF